MKVSKFNAFFRKAGVFQIKHRLAFLICILLVTVFCCAGITKLKLDSNEEDWFADWEETKINQDHFEDLFGSEDSVMALITADDVFAPEVLSAIERISERMELEIPYAKDVTSITRLSLPVGTEDGFNIVNPFEDGIPNNKADIAEKKAFILSRESLINNLVSDDATETWIVLSLEAYSEPMEEAKMKIAPPAMQIFEEEASKSGAYQILPMGFSYTEYEEDLATNKEVAIRISIGFVVMVLCLLIFVRSLRGLLIPMFSTVFAIGSVLGLSGWLGIKGDNTMVALPVLLAMALSVGYSIHYINSFRMHFRKTGKRYESVINAVEETGWPILFTVITTMAGMISFLFAGIGPIRWVGGASAACVFAVYVYVIILIPIFMSFGKDKAVAQNDSAVQENSGATKTDKAFEKAGEKILGKKWIVVAVSAVLIAGMIPGLFKIKVNMDYVEMMGKKIPYVARVIKIMNAKLGSLYSYNVMIEYPDIDDIKSVDVMNNIDELSKRLGALSQTRISGTKPRVTSVTSTVKEMYRTLNSDDTSFYKIPEDDDILIETMMLYELSSGEELYNWIDEDYTTTYIHVELKGYDADKMVKDLEGAKQAARELFPDAKTCIVGEVVNYAEMNSKLVKGELKSFLGSFIIILVLMIIAFASLRTGFIGMIPNIAPVLMIGGVMGYFHVSLDMLTMTVMPMILGIAVDDTIHFTNHIKLHFEQCGNYKTSVLNSFREIGKTMGMTTFILCSMFLVFWFSPMTCLARIGYLSIIGLGSALVADYTLTPVLIFITKPFGKERG